MINRVVAVAYHFILDLILVQLFLFFFFIGKKELPPTLLLFALAMGSILLFTILLEKIPHKGKRLFFVTIFPLLLVVGYSVGLPVYGAVLLGLFIYWRGTTLYIDFSEHSETLLILFSFFLGIFVLIYSAMIHYPYQSYIITLLIIQILGVLLGGFIRKWCTLQEDKSRFALYFLTVLTGILIIVITITFTMKYISFLFFTVLQSLALLFAYLAGKLLIRLEPLILKLWGQENSNPHSSGYGGPAGVDPNQPYLLNGNTFLLFFFLVGIIVVVYFLYKKKFRFLAIESNLSPFVEISEGNIGQSHKSFFPKKMRPPEDVIRREIFYFEKYADKLKLGRRHFETLEEWWKRIGIIGTEEAISIYEKIRYGGKVSSSEEQQQVKSEISRLKEQLKAIRKDLNK